MQRPRTIIQGIDQWLRSIALFFLLLYQKILSPDTGRLSVFFAHRVCAHHPSCSNYSRNCFSDFTFFKAIVMTMERITRCWPSNEVSYDPHRFRVAFASSAPIGIPFLDMIAKHDRCELVCVVTMPDAPQGRGMKIQENCIATHARSYLAEQHILKPAKINPHKSDEGAHFAEILKRYAIDYLVVIAYGKIIPQTILAIPAIIPINVHWSLLPAYRWASPIQQSLRDWCTETWVTIMKMEAWLDTWPILKTKTIPLRPITTAADLIAEMMTIWPKLLLDTMIDYPRGFCPAKAQNENYATHTTKITKNDGVIIPWHDTLRSCLRKYNAYYLWPKIRFLYQDKRHIIESLTIDHDLIHNANHPWWDEPLWDTSCQHMSKYVKHIMIKPENKKAFSRDAWKQWIHAWAKKINDQSNTYCTQ